MNSKILLFVFAFFSTFLIFSGYQTTAQVTLSTSPYSQDFNSIATNLPTGWTVRTGATASALGTVATPILTATSWNSTSGNFRNVASATGLSVSSDASAQSGSTNRALAVRQTGSLGDPGAAFVLQLINTTGLSNFSMSFKLQSLDGSATTGRTTTWKVDYGFGSAPSSFTLATTNPATISTTLSTAGWGSTDVTVNFGTALDNQSGNVWIRIVTLSVTTGSLNRPTSAIDDVSLSFVAGDFTPPSFTYSYPRFTDFTTSGVTLLGNLTEAGKIYYVALPDGNAAPSSLQVKNGQDAGGNSLAAGFYGAINVAAAETEYNAVINSLSSATDYDIYFVTEDAALNLQNNPRKLDLRTNTVGDVTPPVFTASYPKITNITSDGFFIYYNQDEWGTVYFVVLPAGATAPTSAQVKQGMDAANAALPENLFGSSLVYQTNSDIMDKVDELLPSTSYDVYIVAEDNIPNLQSSPVKIAITTAALFTENFNSCDATASFTQYSVAGDQVWGCVDFGYNSSKGLRMNGFSGSAIANEDWLISPVLNLNASPALSFYSQFSFAGNGLQLKISTDYTGSGNPSAATWADLNGNFPTVAVGSTSVVLSDWTLSNVDLSAYAGQKVFIAFVYTSTSAAASRWTLDEINVSGAVPSYLSVTPSALQFISAGTTKSYILKGVNLQNNVTITAPANFSLSKDNSTFANTVSYTAAEANAQQTVYVKFDVATPTTDSFSGIISNTSAGVSSKEIAVKGTDKSQTFDIVTYNLEFFGTDVKDASNVEFGPTDDALQVANVTTVMQTLGADIFAVEEIADDNAFNQLVTNLAGYDKIVSNRWSYSFNPPEATFPPQKIGFIYNTSTVQVVSSRVMFGEMYDAIQAGTVTLPSYPGGTSSSFWSSGRLPFMVTFDVTIKGVKRRIRMIDIHSKSGSAQADYDRRKYDVKVLHDSLAAHYPHDNIVLLGDFNDDVDSSILTGAESSYKVFVDDAVNFKVLTYPLSQTGAGSFPSSNSFLDHIIISDELANAYVTNSTAIEDARNFISNYVNTTSDHLPVSTRLLLSSKADQTITFAALSDKVLGDASFALTATTSSSLPVSYSTTSDKVTIAASQVSITKAGRVTISATQAGNVDYNAALPVSQSFCVKPAKPSVTINTASATLTSSASAGNQWYLNGVAIDGAVNATYNATSSGAYKVQVKVDDCLSTFSDELPVVVTGIESSQSGISVYPNPVEDELIISGVTTAVAEIYLIDVTGRGKVMKSDHYDSDHLRVDVSELTSGLYLARIQEGTSFVQIKFVKK